MNEKYTFNITPPTYFPLKENVVGQARLFIDELEESIKFKGIYNSLGIKPNKSYLLQSEPGMGKTYAVKAFNNSFNKKIFSIVMDVAEKNKKTNIDIMDFGSLLFEYDIGKYGTAYINMGSRTIQAFFDTIFEYANRGINTIVSLDECDALLGSRKNSLQTHNEDRKVLETIMKNLQIIHDIDNAYIIMMTNTPEDIDVASVRAGRIDRKIKFELPNLLERKLAYENAINFVNERAGYKVIRNYNSETLGEISNGFNYADIYQSTEKSLREKAKEMIKNKKPGIIRSGYIKQKSLENSIKKHKDEFKKVQTKRVGFI